MHVVLILKLNIVITSSIDTVNDYKSPDLQYLNTRHIANELMKIAIMDNTT